MTAAEVSAAPFLPNYLPYLLQRADDALSRPFHRHLRAEGIVVSEWRVLAVLLDDGECPLSVLAERTMLPQPTTTHAVARLEARGLVARRAGAGDRRQRIVCLTPAGCTLASRLVEEAQAHERRLLDRLANIDVERIARSVQLLVEQLDASDYRF